MLTMLAVKNAASAGNVFVCACISRNLQFIN